MIITERTFLFSLSMGMTKISNIKMFVILLLVMVTANFRYDVILNGNKDDIIQRFFYHFADYRIVFGAESCMGRINSLNKIRNARGYSLLLSKPLI